ncbi:MAG: type II toxin-antitoxin system PrlF family antitoxin [Parachlamydiales bacterium]|nr:type II toxin-antitoxin system PrlF family antitoxin [Parachlamydiales bacterium]
MSAKSRIKKRKQKLKSAPKVRSRYASRLTSKYQATIPKEIRKALHLEKGDKILYELLPDDTVVIRKNHPLDVEYFESLNQTMNEWESEEDEQAYKNL